jgi:hypothetical protein
LNPLETGFETATTMSMILPQNSRVYNRCDNESYFGRQIIQLSQQSFGKWTDTNVNVYFKNKYIFSGNYTEGKTFFIFSKPFDFPFKIADIIYLTSAAEQYCFKNAPSQISDELKNLNQPNIFLENCPQGSTNVCFSSTGNCDINVNTQSKYVEKSSGRMYFDNDALMYGAIFSDPITYECQVNRLIKRDDQLVSIYLDKDNLISANGCNSNMKEDLISFDGILKNFRSSLSLNSALVQQSQDLQNKNEGSRSCRLW